MRQFIASTLPDKAGRIVLTDKEQRYLLSVLRLRHDDIIDTRLPNGLKIAMQLCVTRVKKTTKAKLVVKNDIDFKSEETVSTDSPEFLLFQFLPKPQKMDLIVRQATECGVHTIIPIVGEYTVGTKLGEKNAFASKESAQKLERWTRIIREARQQSGSPINTTILEPYSIETAMKYWHEHANNERLAFMLQERQENQENLFSIMQKNDVLSKKRIGFAIGCEGGISPKELAILTENSFLPIHLNTNILRAETATLYAFAVLQTVVVEYNTWKELKG